MEISSWKKSKALSGSGTMISVSKDEAIKIIKSLSSQIASNSPNTGREEFYTKKGEYFSICVSDSIKSLKEQELEMDYIYSQIANQAKWT